MNDDQLLLKKLIVKKNLFQCYSELTGMMHDASLETLVSLLQQRQELIDEIELLDEQIKKLMVNAVESEGFRELTAMIQSQILMIMQLESTVFSRLKAEEASIFADIKKNNELLKVKNYLVNSQDNFDSGTLIHPDSNNA